MPPHQFDSLIDRHLRERADQRLLRARRAIEPVDATHVRLDGRLLVNFASNNYLGLTHHPRVREALERGIAGQGAGSGAAGLISGYSPAHASAEAALARWKGTEAAVLLPSGYQANLAAIQSYAALGEAVGTGTRFLVDKLAHASLIDAVRATRSSYRIFPHNQLSKLERLLKAADPDELQVVVTESIFSMDGDAADLHALAALKERRPFQLLLDEAHGSGVYGSGGAGYANELGLASLADVSVVTCSKAMGLIGGAVCCTARFRDLLLQHGRAYIYSTSVPAFIADGIEAALGVMRDEPQRQERVRALARWVRQELGAASFDVHGHADSPIVPLILGDESDALAAAGALEDNGLLVVAVRPPTIPKGTSRLRITLSSEHLDGEVDRLIEVLGAVLKR